MKKISNILRFSLCIGLVFILPTAEAAFLSVSPTGAFDAQSAAVTSITYDIFLNVEEGESFTFVSWDYVIEYDTAELDNWTASEVLAGGISETASSGTLCHLFLSLNPAGDLDFTTPGAYLLASITFDITDPVGSFDGMPDLSVRSQTGELIQGFTTDQEEFLQFQGAEGADVGASENMSPTADAGPDQTVAEDSLVNLDGSGSSDPDDGIDTYLWEQTDGPQVTISNANSVRASFTAPQAGNEEVMLTFLLTVTDRGGLSSTDQVSVSVSSGEDLMVSDLDGIYKDELQTISAYVQTYATGELLVILTPDLMHWYVFLDSDWTDGMTSAPDLANQGHTFTMSFVANGEILASLVYGEGGSDSWALQRVFRSLQSSPLQDGIYKRGQVMNLYVQSYEEGSAVFIFTPNALEWTVFLDSDYSNGISVSDDLANTQYELVMTSAGQGVYNAMVTPPSGPADTYLLNRVYAAPKVLAGP